MAIDRLLLRGIDSLCLFTGDVYVFIYSRHLPGLVGAKAGSMAALALFTPAQYCCLL